MGKTSVLIAYSLGKAQRLLTCLGPLGVTVFAHGAVANVQEVLLGAGIGLPPVVRVTPDTPRGATIGQVLIAPPGAEDSPWMSRFPSAAIGICSGWMQVRGNVRRRNADAGFALSDHADWPGLLEAVKATGAEKIFVTHGFQAALSRYLNETGTVAAEVKTEYGEEETVGAKEGAEAEGNEDGSGLSVAEEGERDGGE